MINAPLQQLFKLVGSEFWICNLKDMNKAGIFRQLKRENHYKIIQNESVERIDKCRGLSRTGTWVGKSPLFNMISRWDRTRLSFLHPAERVIKFVAV